MSTWKQHHGSSKHPNSTGVYKAEDPHETAMIPADSAARPDIDDSEDGVSRKRDRMLDETQQQAIVTRLNRIEGQVRGIRRMVQEPRLCVDILQQLAAAEAALNRISLAVFKFHVERCVPDAIAKGEPEKTKGLSELVDIFDRFAK